jgi:hypothetical protein
MAVGASRKATSELGAPRKATLEGGGGGVRGGGNAMLGHHPKLWLRLDGAQEAEAECHAGHRGRSR